MSRQLPRLTDTAVNIEHNPIWKRVPSGVLQLVAGATIFGIVYSVLSFIY